MQLLLVQVPDRHLPRIQYLSNLEPQVLLHRPLHLPSNSIVTGPYLAMGQSVLAHHIEVQQLRTVFITQLSCLLKSVMNRVLSMTYQRHPLTEVLWIHNRCSIAHLSIYSTVMGKFANLLLKVVPPLSLPTQQSAWLARKELRSIQNIHRHCHCHCPRNLRRTPSQDHLNGHKPNPQGPLDIDLRYSKGWKTSVSGLLRLPVACLLCVLSTPYFLPMRQHTRMRTAHYMI